MTDLPSTDLAQPTATASCCGPDCCGGSASTAATQTPVVDSAPTHESVREHYGALARSNQSCCGSDCCNTASTLYDLSLLETVPTEVASLSLGCGDPVTIAGLQPGEVVLDLGSGAGLDCFLAAKQVGPTGRVIGVDMTPDMLVRARANLAKTSLSNVEFREGQIEALPVENDSVDVIMSNCVINLSPDKPAVFRESFRVLRPGGRFAVSDIVTEGAFSDLLRSSGALWSACVSGAIDVNDYVRQLAEVGFVDVAVESKEQVTVDVAVKVGVPSLYSARITARKPA